MHSIKIAQKDQSPWPFVHFYTQSHQFYAFNKAHIVAYSHHLNSFTNINVQKHSFVHRNHMWFKWIMHSIAQQPLRMYVLIHTIYNRPMQQTNKQEKTNHTAQQKHSNKNILQQIQIQTKLLASTHARTFILTKSTAHHSFLVFKSFLYQTFTNLRMTFL